MHINTERRKYKRFEYEALIAHDILAQKKVYRGKIYNFSKGGLYFESDQILNPGEQLCLEVISHSDSAGSDVHLFYGVEITWHRLLKNSYLRHGFGARFISPEHSPLKNLDVTRFEKAARLPKDPAGEKDPRRYVRQSCHQKLLFSCNQRTYEGLVKDISNGGAFIATDHRFALGQAIQMVIADSKINGPTQRIGWVVRLTPEGIAVRFDRRSGKERRCDLDRRTGRDRRRLTRAQKDRLRVS